MLQTVPQINKMLRKVQVVHILCAWNSMGFSVSLLFEMLVLCNFN